MSEIDINFTSTWELTIESCYSSQKYKYPSLKFLKLDFQKINPLIVIFPIFLPFFYIIFFATLTGLFDNFLLLIFKIFNLSYEKYSSIASFISSLPYSGGFFFPIYFFMAYFFYPLQKQWIKNKKLKKISSALIFLWWFFSGLLVTLLAFVFFMKAFD